MISPTAIERPAAWRPWVVGLVILLGLSPALPVAWGSVGGGMGLSVGPGFPVALRNAAAVAAVVAAAAFVVGLPLGVVAGLYRFPGRTPVLAAAALPLLVPSFLWALGWSALAARAGGRLPQVLSGAAGCCVVFLSAAVPLVLLTAMAATANLSASQVEAVRLAGGERATLRNALRNAAVPAAAAACLAAVLTLSDPGPGQILGMRTAASEVLTSFAALYDFDLAGRQCVLLTLSVLAAAVPLALLAAPRLGGQLLARQVRPYRAGTPRHALLLTAAFCVLVVLSVGVPILGLTMPLRHVADLSRAARRLTETGLDTLLYAAGSGLIAVTLGWVLALAVARRRGLAGAALAGCMLVFAQPPALLALGLMRLAADAPEAADPLLRSRLTVAAALAARLFPVAAVLSLRAWAGMPASWAWAAGVHGVGLGPYARRVLLPHFLPVLLLGAVLVALLATADVSTVLLLHPPGHPSLPLAVFTVMANAPESLVAALCLAYLAAAAAVLWAVLYAAGRRGA